MRWITTRYSLVEPAAPDGAAGFRFPDQLHTTYLCYIIYKFIRPQTKGQPMNVRAFVAIGAVCVALTLTGCGAAPVDTDSTETTEVTPAGNWTYVPDRDFYHGGYKYEVYYSCFGTTAGYIAVRDRVSTYSLPPLALLSIDNSPECVG